VSGSTTKNVRRSWKEREHVVFIELYKKNEPVVVGVLQEARR
jgi:hypothetical protein